MKHTDLILKKKILALQNSIQTWAEDRQLWNDCGFKTFSEEYDDEPSNVTATVTVLWTESYLNQVLGGEDGDLLDEFDQFIKTTGFWYECHSHCFYHFYAVDKELNEAYIKYFEWQWILSLIQPDYTDLYNEIYEYFGKQEDKFYALQPRQFEILISEIFRNQGYITELGKGQGDGGIDVKLFQKDEIDQIVTLVQVKKYKPTLPVKMEAVAALSAIVDQENANRGLFITTSRYLPQAKKFAERKNSRLTLASSKEVVYWCENVKNKIIRDKSQLISDNQLLTLINSNNSDGLAGRIVNASVGYGMISNEFCIILKDTPRTVLLMKLPVIKTLIEPPYITIGHEIPRLDETILLYKNQKNVFRAQKYECGTKFWGNGHLYYLWDNKPLYFDHND